MLEYDGKRGGPTIRRHMENRDMEKWFVSAKKADFHKWAADFGISPVLARIIRNRDITEEDEVRAFLKGTLQDCFSPWLMQDMQIAVETLLTAIEEGRRIRVIGDYDVDGICSAYILSTALSAMGATADTMIPHRIHDGYGLNDQLIIDAAASGVELIVTCDNGISAGPQIDLAAEKGIRVIVTDHHEVPFVMENGEKKEVLPKAAAVVDPKRADCPYPYKNICGAVVAYKLVLALLEKKGADEATKDLPDKLLEFAAIATVCDVMELKSENRIIVKEGLKRLKNTANPGLKALMEVNGVEPEKLSAYHLGFVIGPCLNATGRLDTAHRALELLQSTELGSAMMAARELKDLNDSRKNLTAEGVAMAEQAMKEGNMENDRVLVLYLPTVHESLAGIIAGRIRESSKKPVFVLTLSEDGVKGSGRSIETYHMFEALTEIGHLFTRFGGHKLAAGLSLPEDKVEEFRRLINENCRLTDDDLIPRVHIDMPMPLAYATEELAAEMSLLEPFGVGNARPLFVQKDVVFLAGYRMGAEGKYSRFRVQTPEGRQVTLVFFGDTAAFGAFLDEKFGPGSEESLYRGQGRFSLSVVYQIGINSFRGKDSLQYLMQHYC